MKKKLVLMIFFACAAFSLHAQQVMKLPEPTLHGDYTMSVMDALQVRRSKRSYDQRALTDTQLSTLLWAACGINDKETKRITAPSAINAQDISLYVCRADGAWRYDAAANSLTRVCKDDLRGVIAGRQVFAKEAPMIIVLVTDNAKFRHAAHDYGCMDAGYVSENIYLACTAMGLSTVARAQMDKDALRKALALKDTEEPLLNHPVGFPKEQ